MERLCKVCCLSTGGYVEMEKEKRKSLENIRRELENYILEYRTAYELEDLLVLATIERMLRDMIPPEKENLH